MSAQCFVYPLQTKEVVYIFTKVSIMPGCKFHSLIALFSFCRVSDNDDSLPMTSELFKEWNYNRVTVFHNGEKLSLFFAEISFAQRALNAGQTRTAGDSGCRYVDLSFTILFFGSLEHHHWRVVEKR